MRLMDHSLTLLDRALEMQRASVWAREFNLTDSALSQARRRGSLSPSIAGRFAERLGENVEHWIAVAAIEAEPDPTVRTSLLKRIAGSLFNRRRKQRPQDR